MSYILQVLLGLFALIGIRKDWDAYRQAQGNGKPLLAIVALAVAIIIIPAALYDTWSSKQEEKQLKKKIDESSQTIEGLRKESAAMRDQLVSEEKMLAATQAQLANAQDVILASTSKQVSEAKNRILVNFIDLEFVPHHDGKPRVWLRNSGRKALFLWGLKVDGEHKEMFSKPLEFPRGESYVLDVKQIAARVLTAQNGSLLQFPFQMYLKTLEGQEYVAESIASVIYIAGDPSNDTLQVIAGCRPVDFSLRNWSRFASLDESVK